MNYESTIPSSTNARGLTVRSPSFIGKKMHSAIAKQDRDTVMVMGNTLLAFSSDLQVSVSLRQLWVSRLLPSTSPFTRLVADTWGHWWKLMKHVETLLHGSPRSGKWTGMSGTYHDLAKGGVYWGECSRCSPFFFHYDAASPLVWWLWPTAPASTLKKETQLAGLKNQRILAILRTAVTFVMVCVHGQWKRLTAAGIGTASYCWQTDTPRAYFILRIEI